MKLPDGNKKIEVGDSSFIYNGVYHPIYWIGNDPYRPRVETLVVKDKKYLYLYIKDNLTKVPWEKRMYEYEIPGGSLDADSTKIQQAENETNEEALIKVKNIYHSGLQYYSLYEPGFILKGGDMPLEYVGSISDVYVAEYDGPYDKSLVKDVDLVPEISDNGKFYEISSVAKYLRKEHVEALINSDFVDGDSKSVLRMVRNDTINESNVDIFTSSIEEPILENINWNNIILEEKYPIECYGLPERKAYPMPDKKHVLSAIKFFNHVSKDEEKELADKINEKIKEYKMRDINVGDKNRFKKYYIPINESYTLNNYSMAMESVMTSIRNPKTSNKEKYKLYNNAKNIIHMMVSNMEAGVFGDIDGASLSNIMNEAYSTLLELSNSQLSLFSKNDTNKERSFKFVFEADDEEENKEESEEKESEEYEETPEDSEDNETATDYDSMVDDEEEDESNETENETPSEEPTKNDNTNNDTKDMPEDSSSSDDTVTDYDSMVDDAESDTSEDTSTEEPSDETSDDTSEDNGNTDDSSSSDDTVTDYDSMVDDAESSDNSDSDESSDVSSSDDTSSDSSNEENSENSYSSDDENAENNNRYDNKELKNYILLNNFLSMHETITSVLDSVSSIILPTPDANAIMRKVVQNLQSIKSFVEKFIQFHFSDTDYAFNLYYYNIVINTLKMNLKLLESAVSINDKGKG